MRKTVFFYILLVLPLVYAGAAGGDQIPGPGAEPEVMTIEWAARDDAGNPTTEDNWVCSRML